MTGYAGNFNKYSNGFDWQPFDFNSIMMYPPTSFGKTINGVKQVTITAKDGRASWGQSVGLSESDVSTIEKMYPSAGYSVLSSVSQNGNRQDLFAATSTGAIRTWAWDKSIDALGVFRGPWSIQGGVTAAGGSVEGISRAQLKLDVFTVGTDDRPYTAAWDHNVANGAWRGWWQILGGVSLSGGQPSAITRGAAALDVYAIGTDGNVYQASWSGGPDWGGWWSLGNPGTMVNQITAIARGGKIDLFAVGFNRNIYTRAWTNWAQVSAGVAAAGSRIAAVSRSSTRLDIFAIGTDNFVYTNGKTDGGAWSGWSSVLNGRAGLGAQVAASARSSTSMDVFITSTDNRVWTADYDGSWHGWYRLP